MNSDFEDNSLDAIIAQRYAREQAAAQQTPFLDLEDSEKDAETNPANYAEAPSLPPTISITSPFFSATIRPAGNPPSFSGQYSAPLSSDGVSLPSDAASGLMNDARNRPYLSLKVLPNNASASGQGLAFDENKAAAVLAGNCRETTGKCLHNVADALEASGFKVRDKLPIRGGTRWAKDMSPLLRNDSRFQCVVQGYGDKFKDASYVPQKGDVAVWEGGPYGHIQMCVGFRANGSAIWRSDFTSREGNWSGLRNPTSHGTFSVYRQNRSEVPAGAQATVSINPQTNASAAPQTKTPAAAMVTNAAGAAGAVDIIYHVVSKTVEFLNPDGSVGLKVHGYSGNNEGYCNPAYANTPNCGPVEAGLHTVYYHGRRFGDHSWYISDSHYANGKVCRDGRLFHTPIGLRSERNPALHPRASLGCVTNATDQEWAQEKQWLARKSKHLMDVRYD